MDTIISISKKIDSFMKLFPPPLCSPPVIAYFNNKSTKSIVTNISTIYFE